MKDISDTVVDLKIPQPFVFTLMPFESEFDDTYNLGIKEACVDAGAYCERVDEQVFDETILTRIYNQIAKADIIVSDMSTRNPNVFYETGYAHALGKRVILLTRDAADIPFDLKHYPHIIYGGKITYLKEQLSQRIAWCIHNPLKPTQKMDFPLEVYSSGVRIADGVVVPFIWRNIRGYGTNLSFQVDLFNPSSTVFEGQITIGLIVSASLKHGFFDHKVISLPSEKYMHLIDWSGRILPGQWDCTNIIIFPEDSEKDGESDAMLRVFAELGPKDYAVTLTYKGKERMSLF